MVATVNVGGPPPMRYQLGGSQFYGGVAVLITGAVPSDEAIAKDDGINARVINRLWTLGYTVVIAETAIKSGSALLNQSNNTKSAGKQVNESTASKHSDANLKLRPSFGERHPTSNGRVIRVPSAILEKTMEKLRKRRIVLAAAVYMTAEHTQPLFVDGSVLDILMHDVSTNIINGNGQQTANANMLDQNVYTCINTACEAEWKHASIWTQRVLPHLMHSGGRIIFLNTPISLTAAPADRARAEQIAVLARQLRAELIQENIAVSLVQPDELVYDINQPNTMVDCFTTPTLQAASAVEHAVSACWPQRRYPVGWSVRLLDLLHRVMGEAITDGITAMTGTLLEMKRSHDERRNLTAQQHDTEEEMDQQATAKPSNQPDNAALLTTTDCELQSSSHINGNDDEEEEGETLEMENANKANYHSNTNESSMISGSFNSPRITSTPNISILSTGSNSRQKSKNNKQVLRNYTTSSTFKSATAAH
ncbi:hypothetical protein BDF19DRAFT_418977 [Syncephalis fuscata]|nr:hypothetical protein BDF19DRAFT_418977 [Syncephalis fuscata]